METLSTLEEVRALFPPAQGMAVTKILDRIDAHCAHFISLSPFLLISTQGIGGADISPRGDPPGFVKVIDERTLLIPDRPGNNRLDSIENILENAKIGCLFLLPGIGEILRVNGSAKLVTGPELEQLAHQGKSPKLAICVTVEEAFFHCTKAIIRSKIWSAETFLKRSDFPALGAILADQIAGTNPQQALKEVRDSETNTLY